MSRTLHTTVFVALLIVMGIIIALFSPVRLQMEPASFTLALHVPIFIALFISPAAAVATAIGTALGFLIGDFPPVIFWRAISHALFALLGSVYLHFKPEILSSVLKSQVFSLVIGIMHAWTEVIVVYFFYKNSGISGVYFTKDTVFLLVGLGGLAHSMVDFVIAFVILKLLAARESLRALFVTAKIPQ
jgi:niacin transporter